MITTKTQSEVLAACVTKKSIADLLEYVPEDCIYDIYLYVNSILSKRSIDAEARLREKRCANRQKYFGSMPNVFGDGLEFQKKMRDGWN